MIESVRLFPVVGESLKRLPRDEFKIMFVKCLCIFEAYGYLYGSHNDLLVGCGSDVTIVVRST